MNERVPTYLANNLFNVTQDDYLNAQIRSGAGGEYFEIYYFGELFRSEALPNDYIADLYDDEDELVPCKLVAKYVKTGAEILLFDEYETDESGKVLLINGGTASWDEVKANGFDYIAVSCEDEAGEITEILSLELA